MCVRLCLCDDPVPGVTLARALLACKSRIVPRRGRDQHPPLVFASPSLIFPAPQSSYPLELWVFARCDFWRCDCTRHHQLMAIQIACPVVFDRAGFVSCAERWKKCVRLCACVRARCWRRPRPPPSPPSPSSLPPGAPRGRSGWSGGRAGPRMGRRLPPPERRRGGRERVGAAEERGGGGR